MNFLVTLFVLLEFVISRHSVASSLCPLGEFFQVSLCLPCQPGYYCANGMNKTLCDPGYLCDGHNTIQQIKCTIGYYCKTTQTKTKCLHGYLCDEAGFTDPKLCPAGHYCPNGTNKFICPPGTYNEEGRNWECLSCKPGFFCEAGSTDEYGRISNDSNEAKCREGFFCPAGSVSEYGAGPCEDGFYCPAGSSTSQQEVCPPGFSCRSGLTTPCPAHDSGGVHSTCPSGTDESKDDTTQIAIAASTSVSALFLAAIIVASCFLVCCCVCCSFLLFVAICFIFFVFDCTIGRCICCGIPIIKVLQLMGKRIGKKKEPKPIVPDTRMGAEHPPHFPRIDRNSAIPNLPLESFLSHIGLEYAISSFQSQGITFPKLMNRSFDESLLEDLIPKKDERDHFLTQLNVLCDITFTTTDSPFSKLPSSPGGGMSLTQRDIIFPSRSSTEAGKERKESFFLNDCKSGSVELLECGNANGFGKNSVSTLSVENVKKLRRKSADFREQYKQILLDEKRIVLVEIINFGSFGVIWKGVYFDDNHSTLPCAVKIATLPGEEEYGENGEEDPRETRRKNHLLNELKSLRKLDHPYIVGLYGVFRIKDHFHLCMEYCKGGDLRGLITEWIKSNRSKTEELMDVQEMSGSWSPLDDFRARIERMKCKMRILLQVVEGMIYLHNKGFFHRDLKPSNILFKEESRSSIRICDFGFSKSETSVNRSFCGTTEYLAPEVYDDELYHSLSHKRLDWAVADVFSFGVILWEVVFERSAYSKLKKKCDGNQIMMLGTMSKKRLRPSLKQTFHLMLEKEIFEHESMKKELKADLGMRIRLFNGVVCKLVDLMKECWEHRPEDRIQTFQEIYNEYIKPCWEKVSSLSDWKPGSVDLEDDDEFMVNLDVPVGEGDDFRSVGSSCYEDRGDSD